MTLARPAPRQDVVLVIAAPFAIGILFTGSVAPFCVPGFHNVVFMALAGVALSGLRREGMSRQAEGARQYAQQQKV